MSKADSLPAEGYAFPKLGPRTPSTAHRAANLDVDAEDRFVTAEEPPPVVIVASAKRKASRLRRATAGAHISVSIPPELERELRLHCLHARRSMSDAVTCALEALLKKEAKRA